MKLRRLDLLRFGPFTDQTLTFDDSGYGLHIVYGPNEAGKSTSLRALRQLLFGIPGEKSCSDSFRHSHADLRIGGVFENQDGQPITVVRRKGGRNSLRAADDRTVIDAATLDALLHSLDEKRFCSQFAIDYDELKQGGQALVSGGGDVGTSLFAAGSGMSHLVQVLKQLDAECGELFKPSASRPEINAGISRLNAARRQIKDVQLSVTEWKKRKTELDEFSHRREDIDQQTIGLQADRERLARILEAVPLIADWNSTRQQLAELPDGIILPEDFAEQRKATAKDLNDALKTRQATQTAAEDLQQAIAELHVPEELLKCESAIQAMFEELGRYRQLVKQTPELQRRKQQAEQDAQRLLQELGQSTDLADAEQFRVSSPDRKVVRSLITQHSGLQTSLKDARRRQNRLQQQLTEAQQQQNPLAQQPGTLKPLQQTIRRMNRLGNIDDQLAAAQQQLQHSESEFAAKLRRLPFWKGTSEQLEDMAVPPTETIHRFENEFASAAAHLKKQTDQHESLQQQLAETIADLKALELQQDVPTEEDLIESRQQRDSAWDLLRDLWSGADNLQQVNEFLATQEGDSSLTDVYVRAVQQCDEIADRLRREAERVTRKATLVADQLKLEHQQRNVSSAIAAAEAQTLAVQSEWLAVWTPLNITPGTPEEMNAWLLQYTQLMTDADNLRQQQANCDALHNKVQSSCAELTAQLQNAGAETKQQSVTLATLLDAASDYMDELQNAATEEKQRNDRIKELTGELQLADADVREAELAMQTWQTEWASSVASLSLTGESSPAAAEAVLDKTNQLMKLLEEIQKLASSNELNESEQNQFQTEALSLCVSAGLDATDRPVPVLIAELHDQLAIARRNEATKDSKTEQLEQVKAEHQLAQQQVADGQRVLQQLCETAGCDHVDELPAAEQRSEQHRQLMNRQQNLNEQLQRLARHGSVEDFVNQASQESADTLQPRIDQITQSLNELQVQQKQLSEQIGSLQNDLDRMNGNAAAANAREESEEILAELRRHSERYIRLKLAQGVLRRSIERYRERNQGPVLQRASELFAELTLRAFSGVQSDINDDGNAVLMGVRPESDRTDGGRLVGVDGMSEGTCDQLYLALRLASLETWFDKHPPVPFVVDDILIQFDDARSIAALNALAELSRQTQVIMFTHHQHLVDLAEATLSDSGLLFTQQLPTSTFSTSAR